MFPILKTPEQIQGIRASCQLAASCLRYIKPFVQAGVSTLHLNNLLEKFIIDHNAIPACLNYNGFPKAVCISVNDVVCHGIPNENTILKEGDILNIDVTTILNGFFGDCGDMFTVGQISPAAQKLIRVTDKCLQLGIKQVKPGNYLGNIGFEIGVFAICNDYSVVVDYLGHGCGLQFHEPPAVEHIARKNTGIFLEPGMTFTIEPMICAGKHFVKIDEDGWTARTKDGMLSAQKEHMILVTPTGHEVLTC